ncbi:hypothetical protein ACLK17_05835 [Escherichia coli]
MARDVVLSDAMMGYLHFIANIPVKGTRWLYSSKPYALATPPLSVINQWQLALDKGNCLRLLLNWHRSIRDMRRCMNRYWPYSVTPNRGPN